MIATRKRSIHWSVRFCDLLSYCSTLLDHIRNVLLFLMSPEDSTGEPNAHISRYIGNSFRGGMKALFWVGATIIIGVLLGQLR